MVKFKSSLRLSGLSGSANFGGLRSKLLVLFCIFALAPFSVHSMRHVASIAMRAKNSLAKQTLLPTQRLALANQKLYAIKVQPFSCSSIATQVREKFNRNKANTYSLLYGGGVLATLGAWFGYTKQEQEKELEPKRYKPQHIEARAKYDEYLLSRPWGNASKKYIEWRNNTEQELEKEFLALSGLTKQEWLESCKLSLSNYIEGERIFLNQKLSEQESLMERTWYQKIFGKKLVQISPSLENAIKDSFNLVGISSELVKLTTFNAEPRTDAGHEAYMGAMRSILAMSPSACQQCQKEVSAFSKMCLMHEMQHILLDDCFSDHMMKGILEHKKIDTIKIADFMLKIRRFHEKRADIFACLADVQLAEALYGNLFWNTNDGKDWSKDEHDSPEARFAYIQALYFDMVTPYNEPDLVVDEMKKDQIATWI